MRYSEIINETASVDDNKIISLMLDSIFKGNYWDKPAIAKYPNLQHASSDFGVEIAEYWRDGELNFIQPFPDTLQGMSEHEIENTKEFADFIALWAKFRLERAKKTIANVKTHNGMYHLKRTMVVPETWLKDTKTVRGASLGVYWTYNTESWDVNSPWATTEGDNIMISAYVKPNDVDFFHTYLAAMDWYSGEHEYEMRLNVGAPLHNVMITDFETDNVLLNGEGIQFKA